VSAQSIVDVLSNSVDVYSEDSDKGFGELLKRSDIEAVVLSYVTIPLSSARPNTQLQRTPRLPITNQPRYIKAALLAGKHVLSEKPVAESVKEAEDLIKWYRSEIKGPTWTVAENWRFLKSYDFAAEQIKTLGKITGFHGRQQDLVPLNWKFNRELSDPD
jgi:hypothetical protein